MSVPKIDDYLELKEILQADSTEPIEVRTQWQNVYFEAPETYLMLRDHSNVPDNSIVLASISLKTQHQGTGTKIINWLENYAMGHGFDQVVIESVLTEPMRNLAEKLGYVKSKELIWSWNYVKTIEKNPD